MTTPDADGRRPGSRAELTPLARELLGFLPDVVRLLRGLLADDRVPGQSKAEVGAALAYLVSPLNRWSRFIPVVGQLDDALLLGVVLRRLLDSAGEDVLREHWHGTSRGLAVLRQVVEVAGRPGGWLKRAALLRNVLGATRISEDTTPSDATDGRRPGAGPGTAGTPGSRDSEVVDGEVVAEVWHDGSGSPGDPRR